MRKVNKMAALLLAGATLAAAQPAFASSNNVDASVTVINPLTIGSVTSMGFGDIVPGATAGTVTVDTNDVRSASGVVLANDGSIVRSGVVNLAGTGAATFSVAIGGVGGNAVKLTKSDDQAKFMTLDSFKVRVSTDNTDAEQTSGITGALASGAAQLFIGGTLNVGAAADTPVGDYSTNHTGGNAIQVTVSYN